MARGTGRARTVYDAIDRARAKALEDHGQGLEPEPRADVPDPDAEHEARARAYGVATPGEIRSGSRFPTPTRHAEAGGTGRVAGRDYMEMDRQRGASLTDSKARA